MSGLFLSIWEADGDDLFDPTAQVILSVAQLRELYSKDQVYTAYKEDL